MIGYILQGLGAAGMFFGLLYAFWYLDKINTPPPPKS